MHLSTWGAGLTAVLAGLLLVIGGPSLPARAQTYTQSGNALAPYNVAKYRTVNNANRFVARYAFTGTGSTVASTRGTAATFKTDFLLPSRYNSRVWTNPQSLVMDGTGRTLYVLTTDHSDHGFITKYNLAGLKKVGITGKNAAALANITASDHRYSRYIQVGPQFACGHGQSLARNPKNGQLWFVGATAIHSNVQQVSTKTLKPVKRINFMLKNTVPMGENLTFDKHGNAYFYTYSNGGWAPKGSVKLYQGKIGAKSVHFHLIMQGLRHNPGTKSQSLAYNVKRNRLYVIADGSIASLPVGKLGHLTPGDVHATNFGGHREFEGLQFTHDGAGYLLTNRPAQVMKTTRNTF